MSDEMFAWLLTCGVFVGLAAWVPFLDLLKRLLSPIEWRTAKNMTTATPDFKVRRGT